MRGWKVTENLVSRGGGKRGGVGRWVIFFEKFNLGNGRGVVNNVYVEVMKRT